MGMRCYKCVGALEEGMAGGWGLGRRWGGGMRCSQRRWRGMGPKKGRWQGNEALICGVVWER